MAQVFAGFDLIGDIHGCGNALCYLLQRLGYQKRHGVWQHPERQAIFVGDIVDRGPRVREALYIVRNMVEAGAAQIVLGNHEFNLLCYLTRSRDGKADSWLRQHNPRSTRQVQETLDQFEHHQPELQAYLRWLSTLPLFLEFEHFRVVHACWDNTMINRFRQQYGGNRMTESFLHASAQPGSFEWQLADRLLRGIDLPLPDGVSITGHDGIERHSFRACFWKEQPASYRELVFQPDPLPEKLASEAVPEKVLEKIPHYSHREKPLFIGHYWRSGKPRLIRPNIACLDYSAVKYGKLVAYRMNHEAQLQPEHFLWVDVDPLEPMRPSIEKLPH
ncbi:metallophosphoesterase [Endozoicomonadaceae bacterium StTr2]